MNQIRFQALNDDDTVAHQTDWFPERVPADAPALLGDFRAQLTGSYRYKIERRGDVREPNKPKTYRFKITDGDNAFYSKIVSEAERQDTLDLITGKFPDAQIDVKEII